MIFKPTKTNQICKKWLQTSLLLIYHRLIVDLVSVQCRIGDDCRNSPIDSLESGVEFRWLDVPVHVDLGLGVREAPLNDWIVVVI